VRAVADKRVPQANILIGAAGWGTPTSISNPRFVRLNFTVNF
jgi:hypothetical protein